MLDAGGLIRLHQHNNFDVLQRFSETDEVLYYRGQSLFWNLEISSDPGNGLEKRADGLYASGSGGSGGGGGAPAGGTTGQVLVKASDADYDVEWRTVSFNVIGGGAPSIDATLEASEWDSNNQQTVAFDGYEDGMSGVIGMPTNATAAQKEAYASAVITVVAQNDDEFTFEATNVPEIDLPVSLFLGGGSGISSSSGHTIVNQAGTELTQRSKLQFNNAQISDDSTNDKTIITLEQIQYAIMPTASLDNKGQIIQYIGETNQNYINGLFYQCIEDDTVDPYEYSWQAKGTQKFDDVIDKPEEADLTNVFSSGMPGTNVPSSSVNKQKLEYSTEETVVGKWIDNNPIYQKTFNIPSFTTMANQLEAIDVSNLNINTIINAEGIVFGNFGNNLANTLYTKITGWTQSSTGSSSCNTTYWSLTSDKNTLTVGTVGPGSGHSSISLTSAFITIQYTKTTDLNQGE